MSVELLLRSKDVKGQVEFGTKENGDTAFKGCPYPFRKKSF